MRIRRTVGRGTNTGIIRSRPSLFARNNERPRLRPAQPAQPTQPNPPRPPAISPLHPSSFYIYNGLHKYTTGIIPLSNTLQRRLKASAVSLKVYSTEPTNHRNVNAAFNAALSTFHSGRGFRAGLLQLYDIAATVLSSSKNIANVFFQSFERYAGRFDSRSTTSPVRNRAWSLSLETFRSSSGLSQPLLQLDIPGIYPGMQCKIRGVSMWGKSIAPSLQFHLKPSLLVPEDRTQQQAHDADNDRSAGPMQPIVDDILKHILESIQGTDFDNANALLSSVERAMLEYLRSSPLVSFVDFHHLLLQLAHNQRKNRFVLSRFLNADGSGRQALQDLEDKTQMSTSLSGRLQARRSLVSGASAPSLSPFATEFPDGDIKRALEEKSSVLLANPPPLSEASQTRTGIRYFTKVVLCRDENRPLQGGQLKPLDILKLFDSLCADNSSLGLSCLAHATAQMASQLPHLTVHFRHNHLPTAHSLPQLEQNISLDLRLKDGLDWFDLDLPPLKTLEFSILRDRIRSERCAIKLIGRHQKDAAESGYDLFTNELSTEVNALNEMMVVITEGIATGIDFESVEAVPLRLAEGLLRTMQFLSPSLILECVQVRVFFPEESSVGHSQFKAEKWRERNAEAGLLEADTSAHTSFSSHEIANSAAESDKAISGSPEETGEIEATRDSVLAEEDAAREDWTTAAEQDYEPFRTDIGTNSTVSSFQEPSLPKRPPSTDLEDKEVDLPPTIHRKLGFLTSRASIIWDRKNDRSNADIDADSVRSLFTDALAEAPTGSLESVCNAFQSVVEALPNGLKVAFGMKGPFPDRFDSSHSFKNKVGVWIYNYGFGPAHDVPMIVILLPIIGDLPFRIEEPSNAANMQLSLGFRFAGMLSEGTSELSGSNVISQMRSITKIILSIIKPVLSGDTFKDLNELTDRIVTNLFNQKDLFKHIISFHEVRLRTRLHTRDVIGLSGLMTSAESSLSTDAMSGSDRNWKTTYDTQSRIASRIYVALGSNVGDRLYNIEKACQEINNIPNTRILFTSALYETAPMYVEDQDPFLNGVCEIETNTSAIGLLDELQAIEQRMGRVKTIDKGPRNIDLDILMYRGTIIKTDRLTIPHPLMYEREFVLRPLCDIDTARNRSHPVVRKSSLELLMQHAHRCSQTIYPLTHLAPGAGDIHVGRPGELTRMMSILNITPDSFSDGGVHSPADLEQLKSSVKSQIANGATIIDIGGQSSRPNAPDVTVEEELSRIIPAIEAVKSIPEATNIAISVDTYRAAVAEAAINAGAHVINDISAGLLDEDMLPTIARLGCTYIMMHMRGTPSTMMSEENCSYPKGLISTISRELSNRVEAAQAAGIRRWRIILDPGIGFSKTADQNVEILKNFHKLKHDGNVRNFAWLIGSSRKSFIGKITGVEDPKQRGWGTAATVTAAIEGGADIVRVHDASEMDAVVKMADAMYRR